MQLSRAKPGNPASLTIIELAMRVCVRRACVRSFVRAYVRVCVRVCVNRLLEQLMSPSSKSQVMFASAFS